MFLDVFDSIINLFGQLSEKIGLSMLSVMGLSLMLLTIIVSFLVTQFSIEIKTAKAVAKINKYLELNPFITDENLVEFNKLMKHIPAPMRLQWQQYMVNRDKKPSEFFTEHNCIEKPFKTSAYASQIVAVRVFTICLSILLFIFSCSYFVRTNNAVFSFSAVLSSLLISGVIGLVGALYLLFLKARRNSSLSELYYNFADYQKYVDRACTTLPDYVDYEILFTRKEITSGIPVLQEYLRQRALYEQEQINKAKESQVQHEHYDFSSLGINGSLIMEKSMEQCEFFTGNRKRIEAEIASIQGEKDILERQNDEKNKTTQRKLRDIQESLDRLKEKLDATTSIVLSNDLRKQRENEVQKQRQLEKESADQSKKYDDDRRKLDEQIAAKRDELEQIRKQVEATIIVEFKLYADKIYEELKGVADAQIKDEMDRLNAEKIQLEQALEERDKLFVEKSTVCDEKNVKLEEYEKQIAENAQLVKEAEELKEQFGKSANDKDREIFDTKRQLESRNIEIEKKNRIIEDQKQKIKELKKKKQVYVNRFFDMDGREFFYNEDGEPYYIDTYGDKNYVPEEKLDEYKKPEIGEYYEPGEYYEQMAEQEQPVEEQPAQENYAEEEHDIEQPVEVTDGSIDLGFTDADIFAALNEKPEEEKTEEQPVEETAEPEFHKQVYDFQWENSNESSPEDFIKQEEPEAPVASEAEPVDDEFDELDNLVPEPVEEPAEEQPQEAPVEEQSVEAPVEEDKEEKSEETPAEEVAEEKQDELDELDKLIAEQNAELERQNQDLSKQLEDTQKVAEGEPEPAEKPVEESEAEEPTEEQPKEEKPKKKAPAKKASAKKAPAKKTAAKKAPAKKVANKKPAKKKSGSGNGNKGGSAPKKAPAKKAAPKKAAPKKAEPKKKAPVKKALAKKEPKASKPKAEKKTEKPEKEYKKAVQDAISFNLDMFNQQLQNAIDDIDKDGE